MKRKLLALLLSALMLCSVLPVVASAADAPRNFLHDEIMNDDVYYHLEYVEGKNYFKNDINLYTSLGLYDRAWYNYFTDEVDIDYATTILLALIEKVEVKYENEDYEAILKVLEGASSVADVINKVNEYTGILDFAESNEWATSIGILNTLIKVGNYSNEMYEAFIDGYASILSAKAASIYYSDLLQYLVDNCSNSAVQKAAASILETINTELEEAVKELVAQLAYSAGQDAVSIGVDVAMSSNTVTAAIQSAYNVGNSLSEKIFKTSSKYGYMCSLAEIYYIEDCLSSWAEANFAAPDDADSLSMKSFTLSAFVSLRESGEALLSGLAVTSDKALVALVKDQNTEALKVRAASAIAKLNVISELLKADLGSDAVAILTATGDSDLYLNTNNVNGGLIAGDTEVAVTADAKGYLANVYNETLDSFVKVAVLNASAENEGVILSGADKADKTYLQVDSAVSGTLESRYATVALKAGRAVAAKNLTAAFAEGTAPTLEVTDKNTTVYSAPFSESFSLTPVTLTHVESEEPEEVDNSFLARLKNFFNSIGDFFKKLFFILK